MPVTPACARATRRRIRRSSGIPRVACIPAVHPDADGGVDGPVGHLPVPHLDHDRVDEDCDIPASRGRAAQSCISATTVSVILEIVSLDTDGP